MCGVSVLCLNLSGWVRGIKAVAPTAMSCLIFFNSLKEMAFKLVLFVAVCLAQGLAFDPLRALQRRGECRNPGVSFATKVEEAVNEMDSVRDEVSLAAMEAYARGKDLRVAVACFVEQGPRYVEMGEELSQMMRDATEEIAEDLREKAERYAERMEGPVKAIAVTFATVPGRVKEYIQNKQFLKAALLIVEARSVVAENTKLLAEAFSDMVSEVPEMADRVEDLAEEIYTTARSNSLELRQAYAKCVEEGGPKRPAEEESSAE